MDLTQVECVVLLGYKKASLMGGWNIPPTFFFKFKKNHLYIMKMNRQLCLFISFNLLEKHHESNKCV